MKRINLKDTNTPERFNKIFGKRKFKLYYDFPKVLVRANYLLRKFDGGKFLDMGCGLSPCGITAAKMKGAEVYAIDFADELIESLKKQFPEIKYTVGDVRKLPYENEFFDYVAAGELLEHFEKPKKIVKEAMRVLKKGGIMAVSVPLNDMVGGPTPDHIWSYDEEDIKQMLGEFGEVETLSMKQDYYGFVIGYLKK